MAFIYREKKNILPFLWLNLIGYTCGIIALFLVDELLFSQWMSNWWGALVLLFQKCMSMRRLQLLAQSASFTITFTYMLPLFDWQWTVWQTITMKVKDFFLFIKFQNDFEIYLIQLEIIIMLDFIFIFYLFQYLVLLY